MTARRERPLVVVALGGNALLHRHDHLTHSAQRERAKGAASAIARLTTEVDVVVTHGNGPQVGLLAVAQRQPRWPLDVLVAETQGMIGYVLANEIDAGSSFHRARTVMTRVVVDAADDAFAHPSKPIGRLYSSEAELHADAGEQIWTSVMEADGWRRTVPSPTPIAIVELDAIRQLVTDGYIPVCCGGGGIPVLSSMDGLTGIEAVVDKDATSALLARDLEADALLLLTDVDGVYADWGTPSSRRLTDIDVSAVDIDALPAGSMGPKVAAAAQFAMTGGKAVIGRLDDAWDVWSGRSGTRVRTAADRHVPV